MAQTFHRRNLPHLYDDEGMYFLTYRLFNSIPLKKLKELEHHTTREDYKSYKRLFMKYDSLLHSGNLGINYLHMNEIADICKYTLHYPDEKEYKLICYTIMPNHIHLVFSLIPGNSGISKIMQGIKGTSARKCNEFLNRKGKFWQDESYDRLIRNDVELYFVIRYVLLNPVEAGLVTNWHDWKYTYCHPDYVVI